MASRFPWRPFCRPIDQGASIGASSAKGYWVRPRCLREYQARRPKRMDEQRRGGRGELVGLVACPGLRLWQLTLRLPTVVGLAAYSGFGEHTECCSLRRYSRLFVALTPAVASFPRTSLQDLKKRALPRISWETLIGAGRVRVTTPPCLSVQEVRPRVTSCRVNYEVVEPTAGTPRAKRGRGLFGSLPEKMFYEDRRQSTGIVIVARLRSVTNQRCTLGVKTAATTTW